MIIIKNLSAPLIFLLTISASLSMDKSNNATQVGERWPLLSQWNEQDDKIKDNSELQNILNKEWPEGQVMPFEHAQEMVARLPWHAEGTYIEIKFELLSLSTKIESPDLISQRERVQTVSDHFYNAFLADYLQRFPKQNKTNFAESMSPFENYFKQTNAHGMDNWTTEIGKDENQKAWALLRKAL